MVQVLQKYFKGDKVIWTVIILLTIFSLLAVYSSTGNLAYKYKSGNTAYYILKHSTFLIIGFFLIFIIHHIPHKIYSKLSQLMLYAVIPLLAITLILGTNLNQASRWLTLPGIGFTFQTSDLAKLALVMYIARILSQKQAQINDIKTAFLPIIIPVTLVCLLILPANFSTSAILFVVSVILMFIGRIKAMYLLSYIILGALAVSFFIIFAMAINKEGRINTWKHRVESYVGGESGDNYQVTQAKIAIATGGIFGKGPGNSTQRYFIPHPYSDFIYAIIIEEYGLLGGLAILFLYLYLFYRCGLIVRRCSRTFPAFLAMGLSIMLVFQALINMAVTVNLLPVTGQTLPLVSMGGSSLLFTSASFGIILSISRSIDKQESIEEDNEQETENIN